MQQHWRRGCLEWTVCQPIATVLPLCHAWCLRVEEGTSDKPANPQQTGTFCWQEANLTPGIPHPTSELIYLLKLAKQLCGSGKNIGGEAAGWEETTQHNTAEKRWGGGQGDGRVCNTCHAHSMNHCSLYCSSISRRMDILQAVCPLICWRTLGISKCGCNIYLEYLSHLCSFLLGSY